MLRPGGVLGLMWSGPDRSEGWLAELMAGPGMDHDALAAQAGRALPPLPGGPAPRPPCRTPRQRRTVRWHQTVTAEHLVGLAGTYSGFIVLPEAERARLRDDLADFVVNHPRMAGRGEIELPMRCHCWRSARLG